MQPFGAVSYGCSNGSYGCLVRGGPNRCLSDPAPADHDLIQLDPHPSVSHTPTLRAPRTMQPFGAVSYGCSNGSYGCLVRGGPNRCLSDPAPADHDLIQLDPHPSVSHTPTLRAPRTMQPFGAVSYGCSNGSYGCLVRGGPNRCLSDPAPADHDLIQLDPHPSVSHTPTLRAPRTMQPFGAVSYGCSNGSYGCLVRGGPNRCLSDPAPADHDLIQLDPHPSVSHTPTLRAPRTMQPFGAVSYGCSNGSYGCLVRGGPNRCLSDPAPADHDLIQLDPHPSVSHTPTLRAPRTMQPFGAVSYGCSNGSYGCLVRGGPNRCLSDPAPADHDLIQLDPHPSVSHTPTLRAPRTMQPFGAVSYGCSNGSYGCLVRGGPNRCLSDPAPADHDLIQLDPHPSVSHTPTLRAPRTMQPFGAVSYGCSNGSYGCLVRGGPNRCLSDPAPADHDLIQLDPHPSVSHTPTLRAPRTMQPFGAVSYGCSNGSYGCLVRGGPNRCLSDPAPADHDLIQLDPHPSVSHTPTLRAPRTMQPFGAVSYGCSNGSYGCLVRGGPNRCLSDPAPADHDLIQLEPHPSVSHTPTLRAPRTMQPFGAVSYGCSNGSYGCLVRGGPNRCLSDPAPADHDLIQLDPHPSVSHTPTLRAPRTMQPFGAVSYGCSNGSYGCLVRGGPNRCLSDPAPADHDLIQLDPHPSVSHTPTLRAPRTMQPFGAVSYGCSNGSYGCLVRGGPNRCLSDPAPADHDLIQLDPHPSVSHTPTLRAPRTMQPFGAVSYGCSNGSYGCLVRGGPNRCLSDPAPADHDLIQLDPHPSVSHTPTLRAPRTMQPFGAVSYGCSNGSYGCLVRGGPNRCLSDPAPADHDLIQLDPHPSVSHTPTLRAPRTMQPFGAVSYGCSNGSYGCLVRGGPNRCLSDPAPADHDLIQLDPHPSVSHTPTLRAPRTMQPFGAVSYGCSNGSYGCLVRGGPNRCLSDPAPADHDLIQLDPHPNENGQEQDDDIIFEDFARLRLKGADADA
ncbi:uncharacterized protein LOC123691031 isoform X1 [Colias croceus]|uniref:uncharacterized protein LOC123691031 isoform X1 n=1 Tax=Colias crocea TaxID=72248 RepID=UPI001E27E6AD|nr:uncharacterized protein LOC123691031 isoform X1 [Colias croceus]